MSGNAGDHDSPPPTPVTIRTDAPQFQVAAANPEGMERIVAILFVIGLAGFAAFGAAFWVAASNVWLGVTMGIGFLGLGVGMVAWGKYLMPRGPFSESRHSMVPDPADRERIVADFSSRGKVVIERRTFLAKILGAASAVFGVVIAFPLIRSLGPKPGDMFTTTAWTAGSLAVTTFGEPVRVDTLEFGGMLTIFPSNDVGGAFSQTMLIRQKPPAGETNIVTGPGRESWGPSGYLAFSKVCTHAGCPVGLYQEVTHQLLCPCHQSVFDVGPGHPASNVFGPAPRPLPQLPIYFDSEGLLRSQKGYDEPIGPGFWSRGA